MGPEWVTAIDAWARELRALGRSPATVVTRRRWVTLLAGSPGMPEPAAVTREHLIDWMAGQTWAPNTRRSARASARGFFAWARERGIRGDDPTADIPGVRVPPPLPHPAPEARFRAAVAAATPRAELALMLAGFAGLRRAEIAQARREDLDD
ncbi:MAG: hypothetical protein U0990_05275, partial [Candidatus Nanopelagicales bacterium]|nr:hypothetical protein [Candidatus Nanopelagicales bacterium]